VNWNQIRQTLEGSRSWYAAPSSFVCALKELLANRSNPRRSAASACSQMELLEIRQVLSAANLASILNFTAETVADDQSDAEDRSDTSGSVADFRSPENFSDAELHELSGQIKLSNSDLTVAQRNQYRVQGSHLLDATGDSVHTHDDGDDYFSYLQISSIDSSSFVVGNTRSVGSKTSVSESDLLLPSNLGESVADYNDTSLIDTVFQRSDSILDGSPSIISPIASDKSEDESTSLPESAVSRQYSNSASMAPEIQTQKLRSAETTSTSTVWHDAGSGNAPTIIAQHSNSLTKSWARTEPVFVTRSTEKSPATRLQFVAASNTWNPGTTGLIRDSESNDGLGKAAGRSRRGSLSNIEVFDASIDLFNSPISFEVVADTESQFTVAFIAQETFPIAVPRLTPETATSQSTQNLPNLTLTRIRLLREGHRQYSDIAVVSTDIVQYDGTPDRAATDDIPRQLKHVVLPRGPPRKQPDTVLRIMDSDAEAHVLQRLRYSIAPRGPSTVTVEMQSPEECSFSGPRVNSEETCLVQLAC
jgi:hypothetical protein